MDLAKTTNTNSLAHVDVAGDGGSADVEPVNILGRQLAGVYGEKVRFVRGFLHDCVRACTAGEGKIRTTSLDSVNPACR